MGAKALTSNGVPDLGVTPAVVLGTETISTTDLESGDARESVLGPV